MKHNVYAMANKLGFAILLWCSFPNRKWLPGLNYATSLIPINIKISKKTLMIDYDLVSVNDGFRAAIKKGCQSHMKHNVYGG